MMAMAEIALLLLVVSKTAALENSYEMDSNHELHPYHSLTPSPLPYPPFPSAALAPAPAVSYPPLSTPDVHQQKQSESPCAIQCAALCMGKKSFRKVICIGKCVAECVIGPRPSDSLDDSNCVVNCVQSSTNALRYDASLMDDRVSSCYQRCKRDLTLLPALVTGVI